MLRYLFIDMNAYFASCEQADRPELQGKPIVVAPVDTDHTCAIAASYPAKQFGIKTGTNIALAKHLCKNLIVVHARPPLYLDYHHKILAAIESCIHIEGKPLSIDEVACKLPSNHNSPQRAMTIAYQIKAALLKRVGPALTASIGIAPNRFLAKVASDMQKPDGLTLIKSEDLPHILFQLSLRDLPGIGHNMHLRLALAGITTVQELCSLPTEKLKSAWGSLLGTQFFHHLKGDETAETPTKTHSVGHSNVLHPDLRNPAGAHSVLIRLVHKAAARLRHMKYAAGHMSLSISTTDHKSWETHIAIDHRSDTQSLLGILDHLWQKRPATAIPKKVGITLFNLEHQNNLTPNLFEPETDRLHLAKAMDTLNDKYGKKTLYFADMHHTKDAAPMRIAFNYIPDDNW